MPLLLCAISGVLVMHQSLGSTALDSLAAIATMDPKVGAQLLLAILFYNNMFTRKDISCCTMLVSFHFVSYIPYVLLQFQGILAFLCGSSFFSIFS